MKRLSLNTENAMGNTVGQKTLAKVTALATVLALVAGCSDPKPAKRSLGDFVANVTVDDALARQMPIVHGGSFDPKKNCFQLVTRSTTTEGVEHVRLYLLMSNQGCPANGKTIETESVPALHASRARSAGMPLPTITYDLSYSEAGRTPEPVGHITRRAAVVKGKATTEFVLTELVTMAPEYSDMGDLTFSRDGRLQDLNVARANRGRMLEERRGFNAVLEKLRKVEERLSGEITFARNSILVGNYAMGMFVIASVLKRINEDALDRNASLDTLYDEVVTELRALERRSAALLKKEVKTAVDDVKTAIETARKDLEGRITGIDTKLDALTKRVNEVEKSVLGGQVTTAIALYLAIGADVRSVVNKLDEKIDAKLVKQLTDFDKAVSKYVDQMKGIVKAEAKDAIDAARTELKKDYLEPLKTNATKLEERLAAIELQGKTRETDVSAIKTDVAAMKTDVAALKTATPAEAAKLARVLDRVERALGDERRVLEMLLRSQVTKDLGTFDLLVDNTKQIGPDGPIIANATRTEYKTALKPFTATDVAPISLEKVDQLRVFVGSITRSALPHWDEVQLQAAAQTLATLRHYAVVRIDSSIGELRNDAAALPADKQPLVKAFLDALATPGIKDMALKAKAAHTALGNDGAIAAFKAKALVVVKALEKEAQLQESERTLVK